MRSKVQVIQMPAVVDRNCERSLQQGIESAIQSGFNHILLDFSDVEFMDSSGLSLLVMSLRRSRELRYRLSLCSVGDAARIVLELTDMIRVFEIFSDRAAFDQLILN